MANLSTPTPPERHSTWYPETIARVFNVPLEHGFVGSYLATVTEDEFGQVVDRLDLQGDPELTATVLHRVLYWVYETRIRQQVLASALSGDWRITGCDEKFLTLERPPAMLATMAYRDYLRTPHWQRTRAAAIERAGKRCQVCNDYGIPLEVHHRTYERRGAEDPSDLTVLCWSCHQLFHKTPDGSIRMPVSP